VVAETTMVRLISSTVDCSQTPSKAARPQTHGQCITWTACLPPSYQP